MAPKKTTTLPRDCPPGKIRNPATGRCVSIDGKIGKGLIVHQVKETVDLSNIPADALEQILSHLSPKELFRIYLETNRREAEIALMKQAKTLNISKNDKQLSEITFIISQIVMLHTKRFIKSITQNTFLYKYVRDLIKALYAQRPQVITRYFVKVLCFYVVMLIEISHNTKATGRLETIHKPNWYYKSPYDALKHIYELELSNTTVLRESQYLLRRDGSKANALAFRYVFPITAQECDAINYVLFSSKFIHREDHSLDYDQTTPIFTNCRPGAKRWYETLEKALLEDNPGVQFPRFSI